MEMQCLHVSVCVYCTVHAAVNAQVHAYIYTYNIQYNIFYIIIYYLYIHIKCIATYRTYAYVQISTTQALLSLLVLMHVQHFSPYRTLYVPWTIFNNHITFLIEYA